MTFFHIAVVIVIIIQNISVIILNPHIVTTVQYIKLRNGRLECDLSHKKGGLRRALRGHFAYLVD
jgi:hypothetical protein